MQVRAVGGRVVYSIQRPPPPRLGLDPGARGRGPQRVSSSRFGVEASIRKTPPRAPSRRPHNFYTTTINPYKLPDLLLPGDSNFCVSNLLGIRKNCSSRCRFSAQHFTDQNPVLPIDAWQKHRWGLEGLSSLSPSFAFRSSTPSSTLSPPPHRSPGSFFQRDLSPADPPLRQTFSPFCSPTSPPITTHKPQTHVRNPSRL